MKTALHLVRARQRQLTQLLHQQRYLSLQQLCQKFRISEATARRDLASLAKQNEITRTYGGALGDYNQFFTSFQERKTQAKVAKQKIAQAALQFVSSKMTCFLDGGTTMFALAEAIASKRMHTLQVVTNSLPVAELLSSQGIEIHLLGGQFFNRQSVLLGGDASRNAIFWKFDLAFLGAEGLTQEGIWNSQKDLVHLQRMILKQSKKSIFCLDSTKLGHQTPYLLVPWSEVKFLISNLKTKDLKKARIPFNQFNFVSI